MRSDISMYTDLKDDELIQLVQTGDELALMKSSHRIPLGSGPRISMNPVNRSRVLTNSS